MKQRGRPPGFDRSAVLEQAMRAFWRNGYQGTSMADLVASMGIQSASIYAAFGAKEALFREVIQHYVNTIGLRIWQGLAAADPREAIESALLASVDTMTSDCYPTGCLLTLGGIEGGLEESLFIELNRLRDRFEHELHANLQEAQNHNRIPAGTNTADIALFYASVQQAIALRARTGASPEILRRLVATSMQAWPALIGT